MTKSENSVSEPPNFKVLWGRIPSLLPTRLVHSALVIMPPVTKNLATAGPVHRNEYRCKLSSKVAKLVTSDCTVCARSFYSSDNITYCTLVVSPDFSRKKKASLAPWRPNFGLLKRLCMFLRPGFRTERDRKFPGPYLVSDIVYY